MDGLRARARARHRSLAIDNPARQAFVSELVGAGRVVNAVALNSVIVHTARIAGPAAAGGLIALLGVGAVLRCVNALSFGAMLVALRAMDPRALHARAARRARPGQLRAALRRGARARPTLRIPLAMMAVVGTLSFNFQVLLPLFADFTWHGTATTYALLTSAMGVGSVAGALARAPAAASAPRLLVGSARGSSASPRCSPPPRRPCRCRSLALIPLGAASVTFAAGVNSSLQLAAGPRCAAA